MDMRRLRRVFSSLNPKGHPKATASPISKVKVDVGYLEVHDTYRV